MRGLPAALLAAALLGAPGAPASAAPLAASFVSSKEWKIRRSPSKEEEFVGDVRYWTLARFVRADWALYRHEDETWKARGNIRAENTLPNGRGVVIATGEDAFFDQKNRKGSMTGKGGAVDIAIDWDVGPTDYARAGRLAWELDRRASLLDGVRLWGERMDAWANRADYDLPAASLELTGGRPVLHKKFGTWTSAVKADKIRATEARPLARTPAPGAGDRHLWAEGRVTGWLHFEKMPETSLEP